MAINQTEIQENIVIVGAGIAGLATALGLHRLGIRSVVLESSDSSRTTGFALGVWSNAWKALDALGLGDSLRQTSNRIHGSKIIFPGLPHIPDAEFQFGEVEARCLRRKDLLGALEKELPQGAIRYSSKIVSIDRSTTSTDKLLHLSDGSAVRTKVLIGCDGVNSRVAKYLGLSDPVSPGRSAIRGLVSYEDGHGFEPKLHVHVGGGFRLGVAPCDANCLYWWFSFSPSVLEYDGEERDHLKLKQFVSKNVEGMPERISQMVFKTKPDFISYSPLKLRLPWDILRGNIAKDNVCVLGDALHPMTPDIAQGGCAALEDSVVLVRCLAESLAPFYDGKKGDDFFGPGEYAVRAEEGLEKYAGERRLRSFGLVSAAYFVGYVQESRGAVMGLLKKMFLANVTSWITLKAASFDCGKLTTA